MVKCCQWWIKKNMRDLCETTLWIIILIGIEFKRHRSEPCLYAKFNKRREITCILAVYVDGILITGTEEEIRITRKFSERDIPDHRCRKSQFLLLE